MHQSEGIPAEGIFFPQLVIVTTEGKTETTGHKQYFAYFSATTL